MATKKIKVQWIRSAIGRSKKQKDIIKGFGFTRLNQIREYPDEKAFRGMVAKVPHLVRIVEE